MTQLHRHPAHVPADWSSVTAKFAALLLTFLLLPLPAAAQSVILGEYRPGRAAAASSLSLTLSTEDKAVLDAIAASLSVMDDWDESDRLKVNVIVGQAGIAAGAGAVGATVPRVTLASDDPAVTALQLIDNAVSGAGFNITQMNGVNVTMGNGASGTGVQRVTIASDSTGVIGATQSGSWTVALSQTSSANDVDVLTLPNVTIGTFPDNEPFNVAQWAGASATAGAGAVASGTPRITLAADDPAVTALQLIDNAVSGSGFNITQLNGVNVSMGNGASGTGVLRVTVANDSTGLLAVTQSGTWTVGVNGAALTALQLIDDLVLAEDGVHSSGESGILALGVRNDAGTALAADGDRIPLSMDSSGAVRVTGGGGGTQYTEGDVDTTITGSALLWEGASNTLTTVAAGTPLPVTCATCSGTGVQHIDDAAFTPATDDGVPIFGMFDDVSPDSVNEGDGGVVRMSANRNLYVTLRDAAGNERGLNIDGSGQLAITVASIPSHAVTNAGTFAVQADTEISAAAALADNTANPSLGAVASYNMCFDGSTWDRCASSLITESTHDGAMTAASTVGTSPMLLSKDFDGAALPNAVSAEGDAVLAAASLSGVQYMMLVSEDGSLQYGTSTTPLVVGDGAGALNVICDSGCGSGTQYTHDAALTIGSSSTTLAGARASAAVPTDVSADNDAVALWALRSGALAIQPTFGGVLGVAGNGASGTGVQRVTIANDSTGILAAVTSITNTVTVGGVAAHDAAVSGNPLLLGAYASAAAPSDVSADGDAVRLWALRNGSPVTNLAAGSTLITSTSSSLNVNCTGGCSGGTQYTQDAALTVGSTVGTMAMGRASAAAPTDVSADNDAVLPWYLRSGAVATQVTAAGALIGGDATNGLDVDVTRVSGTVTISGTVTANAGTNLNTSALALESGGNLATIAGAVRAEDVASADAHTGIPALAVRKATPANTSGTDGDYENLQVSAGRLWVDPSGVTLTVASHAVTNAGTFAVQVDGAALTALQLIDNLVLAEDSVAASTDPGVGVLFVRRDAASAGAADGDYANPSVDSVGAVRIVEDQGVSSLKYTSVGATEDEHAVKASAGVLYSITTTNTNAAARYLRCENDTAANTTPGSETVELDLAIPGATTGAGFTTTFPKGWAFSTALTCWVVTGAADSDVAEVAANEIKIFYTFR
jgi:hypothetical protein